jgi:hypothetical protein
VRRLHRHDVRRFAGAVLTSYVAAYCVHLALVGTVFRTMALLGVRPGTLRHTGVLELSWAHPLRGAAMLALLLTFTALGPC